VARIVIRRLKKPSSCRHVARTMIHLKSSGQGRTVEPAHSGCKYRGAVLSGVYDDGGRTETGYRPSPLSETPPVCRPARVLGPA
jgi:hypothetical protein